MTGACLAKYNHKIICVDINREKVDMINNQKSPIYEKNLEEILKEYKENIKATTNYEEAIKNSEITFICVGTPSNNDGSINLDYIKESAIEIAKQIKKLDRWHIVVVKSTVIPGTSEKFVKPLLEKYSGKKAGIDFGLAMNPEFLREGVAVDDFLHPDRIVIGALDEKSNEILKKIYKDFSKPIIETNLSEAEMIKYASNCFLATKISFINEIGTICKLIGIDTYKVADGMGYDKRICRAFLNSGIGWGGSCFPKDLLALKNYAEKNNIKPYIIENIIKRNDVQPLILIDLLKKHIPDIKNKTIGILGLSFKPNTDDIRYSRSIPIVKKLIKEGAKIIAYDPQAIDNFRKLYPDQITYCNDSDEVLKSDAILIITEWDEFKKLDYTGKIVIDGRRIKEAEKAKIYEGACW